MSNSKRFITPLQIDADRPRVSARQCVWSVLLAVVCPCALAQALYRLTDLGPTAAVGFDSTGTSLNASGQVAGDFDPNCVPPSCINGSTSHAFVWLNNGSVLQNLGPPQPGEFSYAVAINSSGQVLFQVLPDSHAIGEDAFIWKNDGTPAQDIGTLGGSIFSEGMNNAGEVTGGSYTATSDYVHAFLWRNDGTPMQDLGTLGGSGSSGEAINNAGEVAGEAETAASDVHIVLWRNNGTPIQDLGTLGGTQGQAYAINDSAEVTGVSSLTGDTAQHAFIWRNDGTPMQDLGTIAGSYSIGLVVNSMGQVAGDSCWYAKCVYQAGYDHAFFWANNGSPMRDLGVLGGRESHAVAMNNSGQVTGHSYIKGNTGEHAFLWRNDGTKMQDLNALIDPTDPLKPYVTLIKGDAINDNIQILADGVDSRIGPNQTHAYLLQGTVLTLSPRSLAFGNQAVKTTSAAKSVTVTNTSQKAVAIASIAMTGTPAGQFAQTNNCGKSLAGHAICMIKVTFKPTSKGAKSATLSVNGGGGGLRVVNLTGSGI
jgi:probable HAF family extracellular repeat protein